jgi:hypothetical protein
MKSYILWAILVLLALSAPCVWGTEQKNDAVEQIEENEGHSPLGPASEDGESTGEGNPAFQPGSNAEGAGRGEIDSIYIQTILWNSRCDYFWFACVALPTDVCFQEDCWSGI